MAESSGRCPGQWSAAEQSGDTGRPETLLTGDFAGVVLRLQADLRWLEACEQSWADRRGSS